MLRRLQGGLLGFVVLAGCASDRTGVIARLPQPIESTHTARAATPAVTMPVRTPGQRFVRQSGIASWNPAQGISNRWNTIVIHHSAGAGGNAARFDRHHREANGWDELGYHFVIGNGNGSADGQVEVGSRWTKQKHGAHCKTPDNRYNDHGIGICLVGDFRHVPPSPAQMASLTRLVQFLSQSCGIPTHNVVTHRGVTGKTVCPGPRFQLQQLQRSLGAMASASVMH